MNKIILIISIAFLSFSFNKQLSAQKWDLKVEKTRDDGVIGGTVELTFSIKSGDATTWKLGNSNFWIQYDPAIMTVVENHSSPNYSTNFGGGFEYNDPTINGSFDGEAHLNLVYNLPGSPSMAQDVSPGSWTVISVLSFTIEDLSTLPNWSLDDASVSIESDNMSIVTQGTVTFPSNEPLPIELTSFDARVNAQKNVDLNWTTATEINNDYFTIERTADGENWTTIATEPGAGNSNSSIDYAITDTDPLQGVSYYRLKQTDFDGAFSYSDIRQVEIKPWNDLSIYPNPTTANFSVEGLEHKARANLYSSMGQKVRTLWIRPNEKIDVSALDAGVYFLKVIDTQQNLKIFIQ
ncbi:MAG: T9SS type A sorting domain-containing protein [Bacteroidales bacterium]|nr:T9SS type A sorting domain-containing protein [Bacteroidales bacterium]